MKPAFHWRIALWSLLPIGIAFALFGAGPRVFLFSFLVAIVAVVFAWRLRSRLTRPLADLTQSIGRAGAAGSDDCAISAIPRGSREVRELSASLTHWSGQIRTRVRRLSEARIRLESVLRAMDEGVLVFDAAGRITLANAAFVRLLEVPRDPLGKTCPEVFRNEDLDRAVQGALQGDAVDAVEFQTGSRRVLRALVSPVSSQTHGGVDAAVMVLEDLTDIRRVERIRRDFVANVSHEFKTPLTSIRGFAETMLSESSVASHREFADTIYRNARYLESLVNDLLVLARIEAEPPSALREVDLRALVAEQVSLRKKLPSSASENIVVECPSTTLRADPGRLSIALSNLMDNAIRYNRPSGVIRITCGREARDVVIEVADQGYGIPKDELPRIFERFYRVDKARTRSAGGTGLGLAIARHAVESQGGSLTVTSQMGAGSTFRIRLPSGLPPGASSEGYGNEPG